VTILSFFGIFSSFAGFVLVKFSGYFHLVVGALIVLMGLVLANMIHLPTLPQFFKGSGMRQRGSRSETPGFNPGFNPGLPPGLPHAAQAILTGPYGMGLTFALVSSPCSSPILFSILSAAAATQPRDPKFKVH
jgi:cytochrome c-type biogenesis protein